MADRQDQLGERLEQCRPALDRFFRRRGFSEEDARDLTQDTFVKAYTGISGFREEAGFKSWILSIAANVWKNELRSRQTIKRSAMKTVPLETLVVEEETPEDLPAEMTVSRPLSPERAVLKKEASFRLRAAIGDLPPRMRQCVELRIGQGLKYREIAVILQVTVDTVKTQLHQARQRLKEALDDSDFLNDDG